MSLLTDKIKELEKLKQRIRCIEYLLLKGNVIIQNGGYSLPVSCAAVYDTMNKELNEAQLAHDKLDSKLKLIEEIF